MPVTSDEKKCRGRLRGSQTGEEALPDHYITGSDCHFLEETVQKTVKYTFSSFIYLRSDVRQWWYAPLILTLGKQRLYNFEVSLVYRASSRTPRAIKRNPVLKSHIQTQPHTHAHMHTRKQTGIKK